jgi:hypothetical protein
VQRGGVPQGIVSKEKANETITLDAFRLILPLDQLEQVMQPR